MVKQIAGIKEIVHRGWGRPHHDLMRAEAGENGAVRHS